MNNHRNPHSDDNVPAYIFALLFTILLLSFLATADFQPSGASEKQQQ